MARFTAKRVEWSSDGERLASLRTEVFVREQGVSPEEEYDGRDPRCVHVAVESPDGEVIGTGRLQPDGRIGRMAVARAWRGQGIGQAILDALVEVARERGLSRVHLNAQVRAIGFYERNGFEAFGPTFDDAGIPHRRMQRSLPER